MTRYLISCQSRRSWTCCGSTTDPDVAETLKVALERAGRTVRVKSVAMDDTLGRQWAGGPA